MCLLHLGVRAVRYDDYSDFHAEPETVLALFTKRAYFERKYESLGASGIEVRDCTDDGERFRITAHLEEPPNKPLPAMMRRITGDRIAMQRSDTWVRGSRRGWLDIRIDKAPVTIAADMHLEARDPGTRLHITFDVNAQLPVMGKRVEQFLLDDLVGRFRADMVESRRLLPQFTSE